MQSYKLPHAMNNAISSILLQIISSHPYLPIPQSKHSIAFSLHHPCWPGERRLDHTRGAAMMSTTTLGISAGEAIDDDSKETDDSVDTDRSVNGIDIWSLYGVLTWPLLHCQWRLRYCMSAIRSRWRAPSLYYIVMITLPMVWHMRSSYHMVLAENPIK